MPNVSCVLLLALILTVKSYAFQLEDIADGYEELLDMSLEYSQDTPYWPSIEKKGQNFRMESTQNGHNTQSGYWYHANVFSTSDHGGTHVDALNHVNKNPIEYVSQKNKFVQGGDGFTENLTEICEKIETVFMYELTDIDTTPLQQYFGPAVVVDILRKCSVNPDYELAVSDLLKHESKYGRITNNSILFVYTGWGTKIMNKTAFWGTNDYFNLSKLHYPGVSEGAAEWLIKNRRIKIISVETGSIDYGQGGLRLPTHALFLTNKINIIESVQNLHLLPAKGAFVFGLPMKIRGASGSPIRLVAVGWKNGRSFRKHGEPVP